MTANSYSLLVLLDAKLKHIGNKYYNIWTLAKIKVKLWVKLDHKLFQKEKQQKYQKNKKK
jgi:hypothetical protein